MEPSKPARPLPTFDHRVNVLSTKKERAQTERKLRPPPSPHVARTRSTMLTSKVRSRLLAKPMAVSFKNDADNMSVSFLSNSHYDSAKQHSFLDQCFEHKQLIGSGCFGNVFSVRSKLDGRMYAVKQSRQPFKSDADRRRRLEEVRRQERLPSHRHCVRFYTAWEEAGHLYMLTELCRRSLADVCERSHCLSEALVWNYMVDLLLAVQHLHSNRLMHLDIKPENIFISREGFCKLGDFGLVADVQDNSCSASWAADLVEGDPRYLAPELMTGTFSPAADLFSLGVSLLELSTDLDVPPGADGWHVLRSGHELPAALTGQLSAELCHVLRLMLQPAPTLRASAAQLLQVPALRRRLLRRRLDVLLRASCWRARDWLEAVFHVLLRVVLPVLNVLSWSLNTLSSSVSCAPSGPSSSAMSCVAVDEAAMSPVAESTPYKASWGHESRDLQVNDTPTSRRPLTSAAVSFNCSDTDEDVSCADVTCSGEEAREQAPSTPSMLFLRNVTSSSARGRRSRSCNTSAADDSVLPSVDRCLDSLSSGDEQEYCNTPSSSVTGGRRPPSSLANKCTPRNLSAIFHSDSVASPQRQHSPMTSHCGDERSALMTSCDDVAGSRRRVVRRSPRLAAVASKLVFDLSDDDN